jgi:hypothetical protein
MITAEQLDAVIAAYLIPGSDDANRETVLALARELQAARAEIKRVRAALDSPARGV